MARPLKDLPTREIIRQIQRIQARNSKLWVSLLNLPTHSPKKNVAKKIAKKIAKNDMQAAKWMERL